MNSLTLRASISGEGKPVTKSIVVAGYVSAEAAMDAAVAGVRERYGPNRDEEIIRKYTPEE